MNKYYGLKTEYTPLREGRGRIIVSYGYEEVDNIHATWYEVNYYTKQHPTVTYDEIKRDVIDDINHNTDEKILNSFIWNDIRVWLSTENQFNFKAAYDLAVQTNGSNLPIKFKLGETEEKEPVYHTFNTLNDLTDFYTKAIAYINQCLNDGWQLKDSIDWTDYKRE